MRNLLPFLLFLLLSLTTFAQQKPNSAPAYFPPHGEWRHRSPSSLGLDSSALQAAISFARENETKAPRDQELAQAESFGKEPFDEGIGPFKERGEPTGLIICK